MEEQRPQGNKVTFQKWPDIKGLHNIVTSVTSNKKTFDETGRFFAPMDKAFNGPILYKSKIKLHGMNAGITMESAGVRVQSRTQLTAWEHIGTVGKENEAYWTSLWDPSLGVAKITIFGEYCGKRVQNGVALSQLNFTLLAVFSIRLGDEFMVEPEDIMRFLTKNNTMRLPEHVHVLPWATETLSLDFLNEEALKRPVDSINELVDAIDAEDPWVKATFGKVGPGEGLVCYPVGFEQEGTRLIPQLLFSAFVFKAKGKTHRVVASKKGAQITPEVAKSIAEYVELMVTEPRLEQGVQQVGGFDRKLIGTFVNWVKDDVTKEGQDELDASELDWDDVIPAVGKKASGWYMERLKGKKKN